MNVTLTPAFEEFIRRKVESGALGSADQVVSEGLRLLQQKDRQSASEVRTQIDEGCRQARLGWLRSPEVIRENLAVRKTAWKTERGPG